MYHMQGLHVMSFHNIYRQLWSFLISLKGCISMLYHGLYCGSHLLLCISGSFFPVVDMYVWLITCALCMWLVWRIVWASLLSFIIYYATDIVVAEVFYVVAALMWWLELQHHFKETSAITTSIAYGIPYVIYYKIYTKHNIQHKVTLMDGSSWFQIYISKTCTKLTRLFSAAVKFHCIQILQIKLKFFMGMLPHTLLHLVYISGWWKILLSENISVLFAKILAFLHQLSRLWHQGLGWISQVNSRSCHDFHAG
jgi:hypothetical protein